MVKRTQGVETIVNELKRCQVAGLTTATLVLCFVLIDTMAFASMPGGKLKQSRHDFISWIDKYLKADPRQPYQYRGIDVYGARCGILHSYSSTSEFHQKNRGVIEFGYHDAGLHAYNDTINKNFVLIGLTSFVDDIIRAAEEFFIEASADEVLRVRVEGRLQKLMLTTPLSN